MSPEEALAQLSAITGLTPSEWQDFLAATPEQQMVIAEGYRDLVWVRTDSTLDRVLEILGVIGAVAGVVSGVAGAVVALGALRSL